MANNSEQIDVWHVEPDPDSRYTRIVFDDKDKAIDFAHEVLDRLFDGLRADDCEIMTISSDKIPRSEYNEIIRATNDQP